MFKIVSPLRPFCCRVNHFAQLYAKKLGINAKVLNKTLWGDYYLNSKTKRILKGAQVSLKFGI